MTTQTTRQFCGGDPLAAQFQSDFIEDLKKVARQKQEPVEQETWADAIRLDRLRNLWRHSKSSQSVA